MAVASYLNQPTVKQPKQFSGTQGGTRASQQQMPQYTSAPTPQAGGQQGYNQTGQNNGSIGPRTGVAATNNQSRMNLPGQGGGLTGYGTGQDQARAAVGGDRTNPPPSPYPGYTPPSTQPQYGTQPVGPNGQPQGNNPYAPMQPWKPTPFVDTPYSQPNSPTNPVGPTTGTPAQKSGSQAFWDSANPWKLGADDPKGAARLNTLLPIAQFDQNSYQYANDFNEAQRRYDQDYLAQRQNEGFQQQLATQQQNAAQWQANTAANQWNQQFAQTQQTDQWANEIAKQQLGLQGQEINNTGRYQQGLVQNQGQLNSYQNAYWQGQNANQAQQNANQLAVGMDQNQASRDVANIYGASNLQQAQLGLQGTQYQADQNRIAQMYGADQGLAQAGLYAGAQNYGAQLGLQGQLGSAGMYSDAQRYQAQLGLQGQQVQANAGIQQANIYGGAQRYQADQGLAGQLGQANIYAGAQRYGSDSQLQGQQYQADRGVDVAGVYGNAQQYQANQQLAGTQYESNTQAAIAAQQNAFLYSQLQQQGQQAQLERENQLAMANIGAYGRSAAPRVNWARAWA